MMFKGFLIFIFLTLINNGYCEFVKCIADCVELKNCHEAKEFLRVNGTQPEICGFNGIEPLVCCAAKNEKTLFDIHYAGLRKAEKKCKELHPPIIYRRNKPPTFGINDGGIKRKWFIPEVPFGGRIVKHYKFTFMTALGYGDPKNPFYLCGGVLVDINVVITAAHCAEINGEPPSVARIGSIALKSTDSAPIEVAKVISHPNYIRQTDQNDMAIIFLAENSKKKPACLFTQRINPRYHNRTLALGFGTTTFGGRFSDDLMETFYNIIGKDFCEKEYQGEPLLDSQLCVLGERRYFENGTSLVQDTCQGDSGGPLVIDSNQQYVVGVVSYGRRCGSETPGVYTHIASYTNWINATILQAGNKNGIFVCPHLKPPYITMSICSGGGKTDKSCSDIAHVGGLLSYSFPQMVKLGYGDIKNPFYECDGVLVEKNVVITAAQCTQVNGQKPLVVQYDNSITRIVKVVPHPNYEFKTYLYDVAILFLAENIRGSPACLWSSPLDPRDSVFLLGFGTSWFDEPVSTGLLQVIVNVADKSVCDEELNNKPLPDSLLCVLSETVYVGEDTYQVNSGGPLFLENSNTYHVVGIVSYVEGHVIYTNITTYLDWIESVIWPEGTQADRFYIS